MPKGPKGKVYPNPKKPTEAQMEERVQYAEYLLRCGPILKHNLMRKLKKKFGVNHRTAETYLARGRERLILYVKKAKDELRADSVAWWTGNLMSKQYSKPLKQNARRQLDKILGLEIVQIEHSGGLSNTTGVDIDKLELDTPTLEKLLVAIRKKNGGSSTSK